MKLAFVLIITGALLAGRSHAQTPIEALDLSLPAAAPAMAPDPASPRPFGSPASPDPPGTYYGDTSGPAPRDPPAGELPGGDGKAQVWGSVSTGFGYSRGYGSSRWNAADINVSKAFGEGGRNRVDLHINIEQSDGPGFGRYYGDPRGFDHPYYRQRPSAPR